MAIITVLEVYVTLLVSPGTELNANRPAARGGRKEGKRQKSKGKAGRNSLTRCNPPPTMTVHSLHIFDRKGKTLFSKTYSQAAAVGQQQLRQTSQGPAEEDPVDEQRKLVFGMLFSLRELVGSLAPEGEKGGE